MKLELMNRDILMRQRTRQEFGGGIIERVADRNDPTAMYEVIQVSDQVTMVTPGDVVGMKWLNTMPKFEFNGEMLTITSEDEIDFVLED